MAWSILEVVHTTSNCLDRLFFCKEYFVFLTVVQPSREWAANLSMSCNPMQRRLFPSSMHSSRVLERKQPPTETGVHFEFSTHRVCSPEELAINSSCYTRGDIESTSVESQLVPCWAVWSRQNLRIPHSRPHPSKGACSC